LLENDEVFHFGPEDATLVATVVVHNWCAYRMVLFGGTVGAGEAYMRGFWSCNELPALIGLIVDSREVHFGLESGMARLTRPFHSLLHFSRKNTKWGSRRNIAEHYDLGNDFFRLFLDRSLAYSCGFFEHDGVSMYDASVAKFDRICSKLDIDSSDHVVEIGTGWGGFALHAASKYGCRVTTTTISAEQYKLARERVRLAGLSDRVEIVTKDYRELDGIYDKLVSIEMIEAVGHQYLGGFFAKCSELLRPAGRMLLQAITIADQEYPRHLNEVDFIKRYIFPGSCIPSVTALLESMAGASDLRLFGLEDITKHYVTTLQRWREAFHTNREAVLQLGLSERFLRMWDFYLAYCEGGFAERFLGDVQMVLVKPGWRPEPEFT
jgi:cyclopropane-fatty-acyl-phospholipid synthase